MEMEVSHHLREWWAALGGYGVWIPPWHDGQNRVEERSEASYYGPAIGQTGTSTRQELAAWIRVLALPYRSMYATDSASMLGKAKKLLAATKKHHEAAKLGMKLHQGNPFGKPWGLQTDGDLWE